MLWTAEAVEALKSLALQGKSASHISEALGVGSRNAVIGKASRIGIKLNGGGGVSVRGKGPPRAARLQWAPAHTARPNADTQRSGAAAAHELQVSSGNGRAAGGGRSLRRPPLPLASGRSEERRFCLLRAHAGRRAVLLRRPLPNGLSF